MNVLLFGRGRFPRGEVQIQSKRQRNQRQNGKCRQHGVSFQKSRCIPDERKIPSCAPRTVASLIFFRGLSTGFLYQVVTMLRRCNAFRRFDRVLAVLMRNAARFVVWVTHCRQSAGARRVAGERVGTTAGCRASKDNRDIVRFGATNLIAPAGELATIGGKGQGEPMIQTHDSGIGVETTDICRRIPSTRAVLEAEKGWA